MAEVTAAAKAASAAETAAETMAKGTGKDKCEGSKSSSRQQQARSVATRSAIVSASSRQRSLPSVPASLDLPADERGPNCGENTRFFHREMCFFIAFFIDEICDEKLDEI